MQGGGRGPAVVPGQPERSLLIQAVGHTHEKLKMPPKKQLSPQQVADLTQWIKDGAAWPKARVPASVGKYTAEYDRLRKTHWAWQPLREVPVPGVRDGSWARADRPSWSIALLSKFWHSVSSGQNWRSWRLVMRPFSW